MNENYLVPYTSRGGFTIRLKRLCIQGRSKCHEILLSPKRTCAKKIFMAKMKKLDGFFNGFFSIDHIPYFRQQPQSFCTFAVFCNCSLTASDFLGRNAMICETNIWQYSLKLTLFCSRKRLNIWKDASSKEDAKCDKRLLCKETFKYHHVS